LVSLAVSINLFAPFGRECFQPNEGVFTVIAVNQRYLELW